MRSRVIALSLGLALSGCVTAPVYDSAVTRYSGTNCSAQPDLAGAISLIPPEKKKKAKIWSVPAQLNGVSPCLEMAGVKGPHLLYVIPADATGKVLEVGAPLEPLRIFAPKIALLDAEGKAVREFRADEFMFRGPVYSVQFRPGEQDRYILVTSNNANVGKKYDSILVGVAANTIYSGSGYSSTYYTGVDEDQRRIFSYEGSVVATVYSDPVK
ncbi:MAG: hypothetical protein RL481_1764 [Pseudomonadota bacterium]|jgi:hypothetical protein